MQNEMDRGMDWTPSFDNKRGSRGARFDRPFVPQGLGRSKFYEEEYGSKVQRGRIPRDLHTIKVELVQCLRYQQ